MTALSTTKLSSKGQVVIPETIRESMGLKAGAQFAVWGGEDSVVLKLIKPPPDRAEIRRLLTRVRAQARKAGVKPADIKAAIKAARAKR